MSSENENKMKIFFCTGNINKMREFESILKAQYPELLNRMTLEHANIDLPEIQGEPEDIGAEKCRSGFAQLNGPVIVEDTSLGFNELNGLPGPYILKGLSDRKWFMKKLGNAGIYNMMKKSEDRSAVAMTIFTYWDGKMDAPLSFVGKTDGVIVESRGEHAFGWDPIFEVTGTDKTYAEMSLEQKNEISHRRRSADRIAEYLLGITKHLVKTSPSTESIKEKENEAQEEQTKETEAEEKRKRDRTDLEQESSGIKRQRVEQTIPDE